MNLEEQLRDRFLLQGIATGPATIEQIDRLEEYIGHALPTSYRAYLRVCGTSPPKHLIGSDCTIGLVPGNNEAAVEILSEYDIEIPKDPMVTFFMHQGYYFEYFLIDGSDDPTVFSYMEGDNNVKVSANKFTHWVAEIPGHIQTQLVVFFHFSYTLARGMTTDSGYDKIYYGIDAAGQLQQVFSQL